MSLSQDAKEEGTIQEVLALEKEVYEKENITKISRLKMFTTDVEMVKSGEQFRNETFFTRRKMNNMTNIGGLTKVKANNLTNKRKLYVNYQKGIIEKKAKENNYLYLTESYKDDSLTDHRKDLWSGESSVGKDRFFGLSFVLPISLSRKIGLKLQNYNEKEMVSHSSCNNNSKRIRDWMEEESNVKGLGLCTKKYKNQKTKVNVTQTTLEDLHQIVLFATGIGEKGVLGRVND
ncbi:hypothetical protein LIER_32933 [Lithospermum erythrorhizon]|uniref:Uncharacterized protein n=1 Tax=Lithospermum erythrorhizon TaxID=34254 RepID=A0AAV3RYN6_LITER